MSEPHPIGGLLLWHKMVGVRRFIWPLALQLWSVRLNFEFGDFFKILYPATCMCFVIFNAVVCNKLCGLVQLFSKVIFVT